MSRDLRAFNSTSCVCPMASSNQFFLLKAEPLSHVVKGLEVGLFPYARFALQPHGEGVYTGVRNYAARNNMLKMALGGKAFYYHASCPEPGERHNRRTVIYFTVAIKYRRQNEPASGAVQ